MYKLQDLNVFIDLSTYCNAGCPQCHRTDPNGLGKIGWVPLIQWSLEEFKTAFTPDTMEYCSILNICGTWGDPIMNKDIDKIIAYIIDNSSCRVSLDTNGSIRDEQWWWELGMKAGKRLEVHFAVDGYTQEMHEKYRRFTSLQKVLDNMNALSETKSWCVAQTIQFKHNQDHVDTIKDLCFKYGAKHHRIVQSDRFYITNEHQSDTIDHFINEHGEPDYLERATIDPPNANISGTDGKKYLDGNISCRWQKENKVFVNIDGQVLPCCWIGNNYYAKKFNKDQFKKFASHPVIKNYYDTLDQNNIFKKSLIEILETSNWFTKLLPTSWSDPASAPRPCQRNCSNLIRTKHQLQGF